MALQGTIDTFELTEVVRLLAAGEKTGVLRLEGSRGSGRVWVKSGKVTAIQVDQAPRAEGHADAMFELLRFEDGQFTFDSDELADPEGEPTELEEILDDAEAQLAEWREIERVVPTVRAKVTLRRELSGADVVLDKQRWRLVAGIGSGITVATLGNAMDLGELPVSRAVKDLIELGVVDIDTTKAEEPVLAEPVAFADPLAESTPAPAVLIGTEPVLSGPVEESNSSRAQLDEFAAGFGLSDPPAYEGSVMDVTPLDVAPLTGSDGFAGFGVDGNGSGTDDSFTNGSAGYDPLGDFSPGLESDGGSHATNGATEPVNEAPEPNPFLGASNDAAEVARQLSNLSPAAARAVAAAAKATTDEEREAALAAVTQEGDEPIDRELLLRFLASVQS